MKNLKAFGRIDTALPALPALLALLTLLTLSTLSPPAHAQGFVFTDTSIQVREGATEEFRIKLSQQPSAAVTVSLNASGELQIDAELQQSGLQDTQTFTPSNWDTYQRVRVLGKPDSDSIDGSASISLTASGGGYDGVNASIQVTVLDDDLLTIVSTGAGEMIEGHTTSSISFRLSSRPFADVTVILGWLESHYADPHVAIDTDPQTAGNQNTATFTHSNWNITRTATLTPINDADALYGIGELYIRLPNGAYQSRSFSVIDDDIEMAVSPTSLTVTEGETGSFKVRMSNPPGNVNNWTTLTLASNNTDVTFSPNRLHFHKSNWSGFQTVTVTAGQDGDAVDDTAIISMNDSYGLLNASVTVSVTDDDGAASRLILSSASLALDEGASAIFKVHLSSQPQGDRTVSLASSNSDVTFTPETLNFYRDTWDAAQTVTLSAAQDADILDEDATINLTGANIIAKSLAVSVTDDDDPTVGLTLSAASLTLNEGASTTFTVRLAAQPRSGRSITLSSTSSDVTLTPATLDFSTSNWSAAQTVTVRAAHDKGAADSTATVNLAGKRIIAASLAVSVADDEDVAVGLTLSAASLTLNEGASTSFTVQLAARPGNDRTVSLASTSSDVTVTPAVLSFSTSNWNTTQTVTVSAAHDNDTADDSAIINLTGDQVTAGAVTVAVTDDDLAGSVALTLSRQELTVGEGSAATFTVRLAAAIAGNRTVNLTSSNPNVKLHNYSGAPSRQLSISFTPQSWGTPQTVRVLPGIDDDGIDDISIISLSGARVFEQSLRVTVIDKDTPAEMILSATSLTLREGASASFTVRMLSQPRGGDRIVNLASTNPDVTFTPATLNFYRDTWDAAQTVTVSAAQDDDEINDSATINLTGHQLIAGAVTVAVTDDDAEGSVGLTLSATSLTVGEGSAADFTVRLAAAITGNRTVSLASGNPDVTLYNYSDPAAGQISLSFTPQNWSAPQTVRVLAASDDDVVDDMATITLSGGQIVGQSLQVTVSDDDAPAGLVLSVENLTLQEGASATFTVRLAAQPRGGDRIVNLASTNPDVTLAPATLRFFRNTWSADQTVTVSAAQDDDAADDNATITLTGDGITSGSVEVTVTDDDIGLALSAASLKLSEDSTATFTARLTGQPESDQTVTLASTNSDVTFTPATLSFFRDTWSADQTVTVSAAQDDDAADDSATINLTGADIAAAAVTVDVLEAIEINRSKNYIIVKEGASAASFYIVLESQPSVDRTIGITTSYTGLKVSAGGGAPSGNLTLTFTAANWNARQTVTVSADQDSESGDRDESIYFTRGPGLVNKSGVNWRVRVQILDDDMGLVLSDTSLRVDEGASGTFTVRLASQPAISRTVELASSNPDVTFSPATLTFSGDNWNTAQTVTVSAAQDDDDVDDSATINLTGDGLVSTSVNVSVADDDGTSGLNLSALWPAEGRGAAGRRLDRRRPEDQPHNIPHDRHVSRGFDHRWRHPTAPA